MTRKYAAVSLLVAGVSITGMTMAMEGAHWGYSGEGGPEHWGDLDPQNVACSIGKNQTPIDIKGAIEAKLPKLHMDYKDESGKQIHNNGHTIQVTYEPGSTIEVDDTKFELKQVHFHAPSENAIDGKLYAMEAHFVHADQDGNLAVIGLMYEEGDKNAELEKAWAHMPKEGNSEKMALPTPISARALLPQKLSYYRFSGSLTTPPCTEGVRWIVIKKTSTLSKEQLEAFKSIMHHDNNRPLNPLNGRVILK